MADPKQAEIEKWRQRLKENGVAWVRVCSMSSLDESNRVAAYAVVAEYEEKQAIARHAEQMEQGVEIRDLQKTGNTIQWWILAVLIVAPILTIIVTIALARGAELP